MHPYLDQFTGVYDGDLRRSLPMPSKRKDVVRPLTRQVRQSARCTARLCRMEHRLGLCNLDPAYCVNLEVADAIKKEGRHCTHLWDWHSVRTHPCSPMSLQLTFIAVVSLALYA